MFVHVWPMFYILLEENSMCLYMFGQGCACCKGQCMFG